MSDVPFSVLSPFLSSADAPFGLMGAINPNWVTANEIAGNITNSRVELIAAGCAVGANQRWFDALNSRMRGPSVVSPKVSITAAGTQSLIKYLVDRANGDSAATAFARLDSTYPGSYVRYAP